jgi:hypothetical protein
MDKALTEYQIVAKLRPDMSDVQKNIKELEYMLDKQKTTK